MKLDVHAFARLGVWASLGLALHVGMVSWARAAETDIVPRWAVAQCVTVPPGVTLSPEQLADRLASAGLLQASPVGYRVIRGRVRPVEEEAARRARISAVRAAAGRAGAAARWGHRVAAAARATLDRIWPSRQAALPLERPAPVHRHHAVCGRVCLPRELAHELARKLGGQDGQARIEALARQHLAQLGDAPVAGAANDFVYWRRVAAAEGWLGGRPRAARAVVSTAARPHIAPARTPWVCPHATPCPHRSACAIVHARELRTGVLERRPGHEADAIPAALAADVAALGAHVS